MIAVVRLYRQHDLDLLTLFFNDKIQLGRLMKKVLVNYAVDGSFTELEFDEPEFSEGYIPKSVRIHIHLKDDDPRDMKAIELLKGMKAGYRCSFIKALFRNTCTYLPMIAYTIGSDFAVNKIQGRKKTPVLSNTIMTGDVYKAQIEKNETKEDVPNVKLEELKVRIPEVEKEVKTEKEIPKPVLIPEPTSTSDDLDDLFSSFNSISK